MEAPGGGFGDPLYLEERVVRDLPIKLRLIAPKIAFLAAGSESREIRLPSCSASGHAPCQCFFDDVLRAVFLML